MGTFVPQDATGVVISDISKGTQTNDVKVTLDSETVTVTGAVTTSGTVTEANSSAIKTAVETIDNAISGSEMQVDVVTMPTTTVTATDLDIRDLTSSDVVTVTGGAGQTADVKVTLDSESVAVTGTFWQATQPVSGTVTANAGTNLNTSALALDATLTGGTAKAIVRGAAKGTTAAADATVTAAGANNAGLDVVLRDATGADLDFRTENENWNAADHGILMFGRDTASTPNKYRAINLSAEGDVECNLSDINGAEPNIGSGAASTGTLRVILATDQPVIPVSDNGGTLTVDGTVTANATLAAETTKVIGTVNVAASQTIAVTQATAGSLNCTEASASAIKTAVELIDNAISGSEMQVDVVAALPAGTNAIGALVPSDKDVTTHTNIARKYYTSAGAVTDGIVWSPAAGKRWHITSLYFQTSAAATITFEDDKSGGDDPVLKGEYAANSGLSITFDPLYPMASGEDAADLIVTTSAGNIYVTVVGYEI